MKCHNLPIFLIILSIIKIFVSLKTKTKNKMRLRGKNKEKGKVLNNKKNGPLSWELIDQDEVLETLLKSEREQIKRNNSSNFAIKTQNKISNKYPFSSMQAINNPSFIQTKGEVSSENQKSKTFRPVGPYDDSTINNSGIKYSRIYHNKTNKNLKPGFYGSSRLTRF